MRLATLSPDTLTPRQRAVSDRITGRRGQIRGPFVCLLHRPELCDRAEALASYVRFESALPPKLREFTLLIVARHWDAQDQWNSAVAKAIDAGLPRSIVDALADRRAPDFAAEDERVFYAFCKAVLESHLVDDATYAAALDLLGEDGLVDAVGCLGAFSLLAMTLNTFQVDPDPAKAPPFADIRGFERIGERRPLG